MTRTDDTPPQAISIWQPRVDGDELVFVRPEPLPLGDHYADRVVLHARKERGTHRICYFGESAAAGYLYAPHVTPARVLAWQLRAAAGSAQFEVVDLARVNETLGGLVETVESAQQLRPDLLVIFTGNNWNLLETPEVSPYYPSFQGRRAYAEALREDGVMGPIELAARRRLERAGHALARIDAVAKSAGIPVILVIPEVNLDDWETRQPVHWLPGAATNAWHSLYGQALRAGGASQWERVALLASRMLDLDAGACPTTFRLLMRAQKALGNRQAARAAAEAEIAGCHYASLCFLSAPQASSMDQELQRRAARFHNFAVVDLPAVFAERGRDALPGRALFLDYCHLTAAGIRLAMAAVSAEVLRLCSGGATTPDWRDLDARLPEFEVASEVEATARLGAAVHSAHRLLAVHPQAEIVDHWLQSALDANPAVESAMLDLVRARCAPSPAVLTAAQQRNLDSPFRFTYQHGWRYPHLDIALLDKIIATLARNNRPTRHIVDELLRSDYALDEDDRELAYPPAYLWEPLARLFPDVMTFADHTQPAYLRCPWPVTDIGFMCDGEDDIGLEVTARLPVFGSEGGRPVGSVALIVNGGTPWILQIGRGWTTQRMRIPSHMLTNGINKLSLRWPALPEVGAEAMLAAVRRLERGLEADIHPIFGEVFSIRAKCL